MIMIFFSLPHYSLTRQPVFFAPAYLKIYVQITENECFTVLIINSYVLKFIIRNQFELSLQLYRTVLILDNMLMKKVN